MAGDLYKDRQRKAELRRSLTNITPTPEQVERIEGLREEAWQFGESIIEYCQNTRERSLALTHLEETVMWAVKAIVLESGRE